MGFNSAFKVLNEKTAVDNGIEQSGKTAVWVRECKWSDCGILLVYEFSCLTGQQQAFYIENKLINKSISKKKRAKTIGDSMNHTRLPN
jgi:hypothetical protein